MSKLMYDSINASAIPADATIVAGYADGRYQWSSADWARFPNAVKVSIACFPGGQADILDIESGCASPADVPGWLDRYDRPVFKVPTLYVNRSNWNAVKAAVGSRQVDYWVSTLDGTQVVAGAAAVQYCGAAGSGDPCQAAGDYDLSTCQDYWPRRTMTRDDWAAICGSFIVTFVSDPPGAKPNATDPVAGGPYYWDYYWADQVLANPRAGIRAFLDWLKANAKVPVPLVPGLGVAAHHHLPASAMVMLSNSGDVVAGA